MKEYMKFHGMYWYLGYGKNIHPPFIHFINISKSFQKPGSYLLHTLPHPIQIRPLSALTWTTTNTSYLICL